MDVPAKGKQARTPEEIRKWEKVGWTGRGKGEGVGRGEHEGM